MSLYSVLRVRLACASLCALTLLSGCAVEQTVIKPRVADPAEYQRFVSYFPRPVIEHGLADENMRAYSSGYTLEKWGDILYNRLSPDFLYKESGHDIYLGESFRRTMTPMSHLMMDRDGLGFSIVHPTQKVTVRMLAVVDWNRVGKRDWIVKCVVEPYRGRRFIRHYYVLAPEPVGPENSHGVIVGTYEESGNMKPLLVARDISTYGRSDGGLPPMEVLDSRPGEKAVTAPPSSTKSASGLTERNL